MVKAKIFLLLSSFNVKKQNYKDSKNSMQLNSGFLRGTRSARAFWVSFLAITFGVIFIGLGVFFFISSQNKTYEKATATITDIQYETIGEDKNYYTIISYTDNKGVTHTNIRFNSYDGSWTIGTKVEIMYNVDDTSEVRSTGPAFVAPLICVVLGSISLIVGIFTVIRTVKSLKRKPKNAGEIAPKNDVVTNTKVFFRFGGKLNQSYYVENRGGEVVYECNLLRFNPIGASLYEFVDKKSGERKQVKIGKTVSSSSEGGMMFVGEMLSSRFKIDGVMCWDYVADLGYDIKHMLEGRTVINYQIVKGERNVATFFPANIKDPFNENSMNFLRMGKGCYRLEIAEASLSDMVMLAFIISRTEMVE